jgi:hypothetical protein
MRVLHISYDIFVQPCPADYYSAQSGATTKDACKECDSKTQTSAIGSSVCDIPASTGTKAVRVVHCYISVR